MIQIFHPGLAAYSHIVALFMVFVSCGLVEFNSASLERLQFISRAHLLNASCNCVLVKITRGICMKMSCSDELID